MSGYANRFKEMLKYLSKNKDKVEIITTDDVPEAPTKFLDYRIHYTPVFRFPLYKHICLSMDIKLVAYNILKVSFAWRVGATGGGGGCRSAWGRRLTILCRDRHTHTQIFRPHVLHVATPGFLTLAACIYARILRIPLVFSYHTHLPIYARCVVLPLPVSQPLYRCQIQTWSLALDFALSLLCVCRS